MISQYFHSLFESILPHTTFVTPNRRLSAVITREYNHYQQNLPNHVWSTLDILPLASWIQRLWQEYDQLTPHNPLILLNTHQEIFLWEKIIAQSPAGPALLRLSETAEIAKKAWELMHQWRIPLDHSFFHYAADCTTWQQWANQFQTLCTESQWLDNARLLTYLIEKTTSSAITLPSQLMLIGFNDLYPQLEHFLHSGQKCGMKISHYTPMHEKAACEQLGLDTQDNEILTMARWAKKLVMNATTPPTIACVIPTLDKMPDRVRQIFTDVFADESATPQTFFNISAGKKLIRLPIIYTALQILRIGDKTIPIEEMSQLIRSPFLGEAEKEKTQRALVDSRFRKGNQHTLSLTDLIQKHLTLKCPKLAQRIQAYLTLVEKAPTKMPYQHWSQFFNQLLAAVGWPGERILNSHEYQIVQTWLALLNEYATLDHVLPPTHFSAALHVLQRMTSAKIFQPQSQDAPIQILGVLEAAGLPFDYLWLAGMDDVSWPAQPKPNPFIPKRLQNELHMPHANYDREMAYSAQLVAQFQHSTNQAIFSYHRKQQDIQLDASPFIRDLPEITIAQLALIPYTLPSKQIYLSQQLEWIVDENGPSVLQQEVKGGVSVIKQQAACPFKAFAEWRLFARELENPLIGLRAKERGTLIHKAIEILWQQLQDHTTLISLSEDALQKHISDSIEAAFTLHHGAQHKNAYLQIEKERLQKLFTAWLEIEKSRPFFKIAALEKETYIHVENLSLTVKVDRIDELTDGKKLIIDYKTGKNIDIKDCFDERPDEPQLPLYCLTDSDTIAGISFANLHPTAMRFTGVGIEEDLMSGIQTVAAIKATTATTWQEQLIAWQAILTHLAADYRQGIAKVAPKDVTQTCLYCTLQPLCRIHEEGPSHAG